MPQTKEQKLKDLISLKLKDTVVDLKQLKDNQRGTADAVFDTYEQCIIQVLSLQNFYKQLLNKM